MNRQVSYCTTVADHSDEKSDREGQTGEVAFDINGLG